MLGIGLMIHETSVIFGAPLLAAILISRAWSDGFDPSSGGRGGPPALSRGVSGMRPTCRTRTQ